MDGEGVFSGQEEEEGRGDAGNNHEKQALTENDNNHANGRGGGKRRQQDQPVVLVIDTSSDDAICFKDLACQRPPNDSDGSSEVDYSGPSIAERYQHRGEDPSGRGGLPADDIARAANWKRKRPAGSMLHVVAAARGLSDPLSLPSPAAAATECASSPDCYIADNETEERMEEESGEFYGEDSKDEDYSVSTEEDEYQTGLGLDSAEKVKMRRKGKRPRLKKIDEKKEPVKIISKSLVDVICIDDADSESINSYTAQPDPELEIIEEAKRRSLADLPREARRPVDDAPDINDVESSSLGGSERPTAISGREEEERQLKEAKGLSLVEMETDNVQTTTGEHERKVGSSRKKAGGLLAGAKIAIKRSPKEGNGVETLEGVKQGAKRNKGEFEALSIDPCLTILPSPQYEKAYRRTVLDPLKAILISEEDDIDCHIEKVCQELRLNIREVCCGVYYGAYMTYCGTSIERIPQRPLRNWLSVMQPCAFADRNAERATREKLLPQTVKSLLCLGSSSNSRSCALSPSIHRKFYGSEYGRNLPISAEQDVASILIDIVALVTNIMNLPSVADSLSLELREIGDGDNAKKDVDPSGLTEKLLPNPLQLIGPELLDAVALICSAEACQEAFVTSKVSDIERCYDNDGPIERAKKKPRLETSLQSSPPPADSYPSSLDNRCHDGTSPSGHNPLSPAAHLAVSGLPPYFNSHRADSSGPLGVTIFPAEMKGELFTPYKSLYNDGHGYKMADEEEESIISPHLIACVRCFYECEGWSATLQAVRSCQRICIELPEPKLVHQALRILRAAAYVSTVLAEPWLNASDGKIVQDFVIEYFTGSSGFLALSSSSTQSRKALLHLFESIYDRSIISLPNTLQHISNDLECDVDLPRERIDDVKLQVIFGYFLTESLSSTKPCSSTSSLPTLNCQLQGLNELLSWIRSIEGEVFERRERWQQVECNKSKYPFTEKPIGRPEILYMQSKERLKWLLSQISSSGRFPLFRLLLSARGLHLEILKRVQPLLECSAKYGYLEEQDLSLLWENGGLGKGKAMKRTEKYDKKNEGEENGLLNEDVLRVHESVTSIVADIFSNLLMDPLGFSNAGTYRTGSNYISPSCGTRRPQSKFAGVTNESRFSQQDVSGKQLFDRKPLLQPHLLSHIIQLILGVDRRRWNMKLLTILRLVVERSIDSIGSSVYVSNPMVDGTQLLSQAGAKVQNQFVENPPQEQVTFQSSISFLEPGLTLLLELACCREKSNFKTESWLLTRDMSGKGIQILTAVFKKVTLTGNLIGLQVGQGENEQMQQLFTVHDCMLWAQTYLLRESMSALEQSSLIKVLDENQGHHVVGTRAVQSLSGMLRFLPSVSPQQDPVSFSPGCEQEFGIVLRSIEDIFLSYPIYDLFSAECSRFAVDFYSPNPARTREKGDNPSTDSSSKTASSDYKIIMGSSCSYSASLTARLDLFKMLIEKGAKLFDSLFIGDQIEDKDGPQRPIDAGERKDKTGIHALPRIVCDDTTVSDQSKHNSKFAVKSSTGVNFKKRKVRGVDSGLLPKNAKVFLPSSIHFSQIWSCFVSNVSNHFPADSKHSTVDSLELLHHTVCLYMEYCGRISRDKNLHTWNVEVKEHFLPLLKMLVDTLYPLCLDIVAEDFNNTTYSLLALCSGQTNLNCGNFLSLSSSDEPALKQSSTCVNSMMGILLGLQIKGKGIAQVDNVPWCHADYIISDVEGKGLHKMWSLVERAEDHLVAENATQYLGSLSAIPVGVGKGRESNIDRKVNKFVDKCMKILRSSEGGLRKKGRIIGLLHSFVDYSHRTQVRNGCGLSHRHRSRDLVSIGSDKRNTAVPFERRHAFPSLSPAKNEEGGVPKKTPRIEDMICIDENVETLFSLLDDFAKESERDQKQVRKDVWELLQLLPTSPRLVDAITLLRPAPMNEGGPERIVLDWNKWLPSMHDMPSTFRLFYSLQLLEWNVESQKLSQTAKCSGNPERDASAESKRSVSWCVRFVDSGGLDHLMHLVAKVDLLSGITVEAKKQGEKEALNLSARDYPRLLLMLQCTKKLIETIALVADSGQSDSDCLFLFALVSPDVFTGHLLKLVGWSCWIEIQLGTSASKTQSDNQEPTLFNAGEIAADTQKPLNLDSSSTESYDVGICAQCGPQQAYQPEIVVASAERKTLTDEAAFLACSGFHILGKYLSTSGEASAALFGGNEAISGPPQELFSATIATALVQSPNSSVRRSAKEFMKVIVMKDSIDEHDQRSLATSTKTKVVAVLVNTLPTAESLLLGVEESHPQMLFELLEEFIFEAWINSSDEKRSDIASAVLSASESFAMNSVNKSNASSHPPPVYDSLYEGLPKLYLWALQQIVIVSSEEFRNQTGQLLTDEDTYKGDLSNRQGAQVNSFLIGLLSFVTKVICAMNDSRMKVTIGEAFISRLLNELSFVLPSVSEPSEGSCLSFCISIQVRACARKLLLVLCELCSENCQTLCRLVSKKHFNVESSQPRLDLTKEWNFDPIARRKGVAGYVGLKNLGATCYMNSLLQQFFFIPALRQGFLECGIEIKELKRGENGTGTRVDSKDDMRQGTLLSELRKCLSNLMLSDRRSYDTRNLVESIRGYDGDPIRPGEQQDVDEFFNLFCDRLETELKPLKQKGLLKDIFGGELCHRITCQHCQHSSERVEDSMCVSVDVKGKADICESLDLYIKGESLDGTNQYFCSECNSKQDSIKSCCLKTLPNTLILHLKRFEFDLTTMRKNKINDRLSFPMELDMKPYTKEGIVLQEENTRLPSLRPDAYYKYHLKGVLIHAGTADSGHYYSIAKERCEHDKKVTESAKPKMSWYMFNDSTVTTFDPAGLAEASFGGNVPYSAYLLFYEREFIDFVKEDAGGNDQAEDGTTGGEMNCSNLATDNNGSTEPAWRAPYDKLSNGRKGTVPEEIFQHILGDNLRFARDQTFFDISYSSWLLELAQICTENSSKAFKNEGNIEFMPPFELGQVLQMHLFENLIHARGSEKYIDSVASWLMQWYAKEPTACHWLLDLMCVRYRIWVEMIFLHCPRSEVRRMFSDMLQLVFSKMALKDRSLYSIEEECCSVRTTSSEEEEGADFIHDTDDDVLVKTFGYHEATNGSQPKRLGRARFWKSKSTLLRFIGVGMLDLLQIPRQTKIASEFYDTIFAFGSLGQAEAIYLIRCGLILRLIDIYLGDNSGVPSKALIVGVTMKASISRRNLNGKGAKRHCRPLLNLLDLLLRSGLVPREEDSSDSDDSDSDADSDSNSDSELMSRPRKTGNAEKIREYDSAQSKNASEFTRRNPLPSTITDNALVTFQAETAYYQIPSRDGRLFLINDTFIEKLLLESPAAMYNHIPFHCIVVRMMQHLCQDNLDASNQVRRIAQKLLVFEKADAFTLGLEVIVALLRINDSVASDRIPAIMDTIAIGLERNEKYADELLRILNSLQSVVSKRPSGGSGLSCELLLHRWMLSNLGSLLRLYERREWEKKLMVRFAIIKLVAYLVPLPNRAGESEEEEYTSPKKLHNCEDNNPDRNKWRKEVIEEKSSSPGDTVEVGPKIMSMGQEHDALQTYGNDDSVRQTLLRHLAEIFPLVREDLKTQSSCAMHFAEYFRAIRQCLTGSSSEEQVVLSKFFCDFISLLLYLDDQGRQNIRVDDDLAKGEMIYLWETILLLHPGFCHEFLSNDFAENCVGDTQEDIRAPSRQTQRRSNRTKKEILFEKILQIYVTSSKKLLQYNNMYMSRYYGVLLILAQGDTGFRDDALMHGNWWWALKAFVLCPEGLDSGPLYDSLFKGSLLHCRESAEIRFDLMKKICGSNALTQNRISSSAAELIHCILDSESHLEFGESKCTQLCFDTTQSSAPGIFLLCEYSKKLFKQTKNVIDGRSRIDCDQPSPARVIAKGLSLSLECTWMALTSPGLDKLRSLTSTWTNFNELNLLCSEVVTCPRETWQKLCKTDNSTPDEIHVLKTAKYAAKINEVLASVVMGAKVDGNAKSED